MKNTYSTIFLIINIFISSVAFLTCIANMLFYVPIENPYLRLSLPIIIPIGLGKIFKMIMHKRFPEETSKEVVFKNKIISNSFEMDKWRFDFSDIGYIEDYEVIQRLNNLIENSHDEQYDVIDVENTSGNHTKLVSFSKRKIILYSYFQVLKLKTGIEIKLYCAEKRNLKFSHPHDSNFHYSKESSEYQNNLLRGNDDSLMLNFVFNIVFNTIFGATNYKSGKEASGIVDYMGRQVSNLVMDLTNRDNKSLQEVSQPVVTDMKPVNEALPKRRVRN